MTRSQSSHDAVDFIVESTGHPVSIRNHEPVVYGADWCGDTRRSKRLLERAGIAFRFVDVDDDEPASAWAAAQNGGQRRIPVILFASGATLIEPTDEALVAALRDNGYAVADPITADQQLLEAGFAAE